MADEIIRLDYSAEDIGDNIDEVREARGTFDTLDARLDNIEGGGPSPSNPIASNCVSPMTGYSKSSSSTPGDISTSDTLNAAIGKLEKRTELNKNNILSVANRQHIIVSPSRSNKAILAITANGTITTDMRGSILISMAYQSDIYRPSLVLVSFNSSGFGSFFTWLAGSDADGGTITAAQRSSDYTTLYLTVRGSSFTAPMLIPLMDVYPEFSWQWLDAIPT